MKLISTALLAALAAFVATRLIALRTLPSNATNPATSAANAPSKAERDAASASPSRSDAATITLELAHRSGPLLLPPRPFEPDGSVSVGLARLLGLSRNELQSLNAQLREIAQQATSARIQAAKLVATTEESATVASLRQVDLAQKFERDYSRVFSHAVGRENHEWLEQQEGLVTQAARRATGFLGTTDTTWVVQRVSAPAPSSAVSTRYVLITLSAETAENVAQSSTPFDRLEAVEPVAREVLHRHLPASFLGKNP